MEDDGLPPLLALPAELIHQILTFLPPRDVAIVSGTCHLLRQHALSEQLWQPIVNENLPEPITNPAPLPSFRELYIAHYPNWFLPRHQLWYADSEPNGKLLVARYDPRRACIEAYAVVAERRAESFEMWQHDASVAIHSFEPCVQLDLNQPVLKLDIESPKIRPPAAAPRRPTRSMSNWFRPSSVMQDSDDEEDQDSTPPLSREVLMDCSAPAGLYTSFMLARDHPAALTNAGTAVWPPLHLPAFSRTRNSSVGSYSASAHRPRSHDQVSQNTFRLRKWIEFSSRQQVNMSVMRRSSPEERLYESINLGYASHTLPRGIGSHSVRMGEEVATYATLPPSCYTPTKEKPWRGIWCGDYSGHGCEFLVVLQPDEGEETPLPEGMEWMHEWLTTGIRRRESSGSWGSYASTNDAVLTGSSMHMDQDNDETLVDDSESDEYMDTASNTPTGEPEGPILAGSGGGDATTTSSSQDVYSGRIEAIKLTGDPNIPRAQYTFIAPDISDRGLVRIADEAPFKNARVVRSAGHIAGRGFVSGMCLTSPHHSISFIVFLLLQRLGNVEYALTDHFFFSPIQTNTCPVNSSSSRRIAWHSSGSDSDT